MQLKDNDALELFKKTLPIDKLTQDLKIEQAADNVQENYCSTELDKAEDPDEGWL